MSSPGDSDHPAALTVERRTDCSGCGCVRCRGIEYDVIRRSLADSFVWSCRLVAARPSILFVFGLVAAVQAVLLVAPADLASVGAGLGLLGIFVGRGYVGAVGAGVLADADASPRRALSVVVRRLPAFVGTFALAVGGILVVVLGINFVLEPVVRSTVDAFGGDSSAVVVDFGFLFVTIVVVLYALVKICFLPEACFVGGYGPVEALRASWSITSLHRTKAVIITAGFLLLLGIGVLLDVSLATPERPVVLSVRYEETTIALRSLGLSAPTTPRVVFDVLASAVYYGVFVHQYVHGALEG